LYIAQSDTVLALFESAPIAVIAVDTEGTIALVNGKAEDLFGYDRDELLGHSLELLLPSRFVAQHHRHRDGYFESPKDRTMGNGMDLAALRKDGTEFPVEVGLSYVEVNGQRLAMSFITDISVRVETTESLRSHAQELESRVVARTQEIERRRRVAEGLHDILTVLNTARPLEEILDLIVEQASQLLATDAIAIFRQDADKAVPHIQAARYLDESAAGEISMGQPNSPESVAADDQLGMTQAGRYRSVLAVPLNVKGKYMATSASITKQLARFLKRRRSWRLLLPIRPRWRLKMDACGNR
jgi:PAS domain S-box-containing protein